MEYKEYWYQRAWRPAMAFIYMAMNIFDYIIRPIINFWYVKSINLEHLILTLKDIDSAVMIKLLDNLGNAVIPPVMNETVHLAFGAILGVAAFSRGAEKGWKVGSPSQASKG